MKIVLLRHGKPDINSKVITNPLDLKNWIKKYDEVDLLKTSLPSEETVKLAAECNYIVCSSLKRSIKSAERVLGNDKYNVDKEFREVGLPHGNKSYPKLKLGTLAAIFRILWLFGYSNNCESIKDGEKRAEKAAAKLIGLADKYETVMFVGHAILNYFISKELRKDGWKGPTVPSRTFWDYGIYEKS